MILRSITIQEMQMMAGQFQVNHESFYQVTSIAYNNYNNICGIFGSVS